MIVGLLSVDVLTLFGTNLRKGNNSSKAKRVDYRTPYIGLWLGRRACGPLAMKSRDKLITTMTLNLMI